MLTFKQKQDAVAELKEKFDRANSVIAVDYRGLGVPAINELRGKLREGGDTEYHVVKNAVLRRAAEGGDVALMSEHFQGPTAVAVSYGDPVAMAKALVDFAKDNEDLELKGGVLDGKAVDLGEIATLATLPSLDALRGKIVGLLQAPAQMVARVLQAPAGQLARLADARRSQLEEGDGA
jgi:large subunit ribosomal protein L10